MNNTENECPGLETTQATPLPLGPAPSEEADEKRLWIGNLDSRLTEYQLIKELQKYGKVVKFDFLFHKTGPLQGQPRGYCFITYDSRQQAEKAMEFLDGKQALSRQLAVKWAHLIAREEEQSKQANPLLTGLAVPEKEPEKDVSLTTKIRAIEAKLKLMEENKDEDAPVPILFTCNNSSAINQQPSQFRARHRSFVRRPTPYNRHRQHINRSRK